MKLYKALKLKKSLIGEINKLKGQFLVNNSYLVGAKNSEKFDAVAKYSELYHKINELIALKYVINEANREIQSKIYLLAEYKGLIAFWNEIPVDDGIKAVGYTDGVREYAVHFNEIKRDEYVKEYQAKVDALQDEIDIFNHTTDIPWGKEE